MDNTTMIWVALAVSAALFQAVGAAIKKKSLQVQGVNNMIGFISFMTAGLAFGLMYFIKTGEIWPSSGVSYRFWEGMFFYAGLNVIAVWFLYRALDLAEFNHLMPFMTLTSLSMIIPPIFVFGEVPSMGSFAGILLIVIGAITMNFKGGKKGIAEDEQRKKDNRKGVFYFLATAACFTFTPTAAKVSITETSPLFASYVVHVLIGLGFLAMTLIFKERKRAMEVLMNPGAKTFLAAVVLAGVAIVAENGSMNIALADAPVASVMAIKRLMPFFAFLIGVFYFKEREDLGRKVIATSFMVAGAIMVTILK